MAVVAVHEGGIGAAAIRAALGGRGAGAARPTGDGSSWGSRDRLRAGIVSAHDAPSVAGPSAGVGVGASAERADRRRGDEG